MPIEIVLLTGKIEAEWLGPCLQAENPYLVVTHAETLADLRRALDPPLYSRRLIAFCSGVIVPADLLASLDGPAYNFHPGPPTFPGRYPARFALYQGAAAFGATVHEMAPRVDEGAIVAIEEFPIAADTDAARLDVLAYEAALRLFRRLAPDLACDDAPLARIDRAWSGRKWKAADIDRLLTVTADLDGAEIAARLRAFRDVAPCPLRIEIGGIRFRLDPAPDPPALPPG